MKIKTLILSLTLLAAFSANAEEMILAGYVGNKPMYISKSQFESALKSVTPKAKPEAKPLPKKETTKSATVWSGKTRTTVYPSGRRFDHM